MGPENQEWLGWDATLLIKKSLHSPSQNRIKPWSVAAYGSAGPIG
jgi:hypothetical protein